MNRDVDMFGVRITEVCDGEIQEVYTESDTLSFAILSVLDRIRSPIETLAEAVTYHEDQKWNKEPESSLEEAEKAFRSAAKLLVEEWAAYRKRFG